MERLCSRLFSYSLSSTYTFKPQTMAILYALHFAKQFGRTHIRLEYDSTSVVRFVRSGPTVRTFYLLLAFVSLILVGKETELLMFFLRMLSVPLLWFVRTYFIRHQTEDMLDAINFRFVSFVCSLLFFCRLEF